MTENTLRRASVLAAWIHRRRGYLLFVVGVTAVFALVMALSRIPADAAIYAGLLCSVVAAALSAADFIRFRARHSALQQILIQLPQGLERLPAPEDALEADLHALLHAMADQHGALITQEDGRHQQLVDYFTQWSHQVKTPLAAVRLLLQRGDHPEQLALEDELQKVERYADMALNFIKLDQKVDDFHFADHLIKPLVQQAVRGFARSFVLKRLSVELDVPEDARATTDARQFSFVLEQLLSNAVKYTMSGGVHITWDEGQRSLCVLDTGPGIQPEDLPRVGELGYTGFTGRIDRQATGIGLYLCRRTCQRLSIHLQIDSVLGQGTRVCLRFPGEPLPPAM